LSPKKIIFLEHVEKNIICLFSAEFTEGGGIEKGGIK